jgi:putative ABC transport system permease protein
MSRWLEDFAYRTPVSGWLFAAAGGGLLAIALATVLIRCVQAARTNPVEHLRVE